MYFVLRVAISNWIRGRCVLYSPPFPASTLISDRVAFRMIPEAYCVRSYTYTIHVSNITLLYTVLVSDKTS